MMGPDLKAILFDVDGTLFRHAPVRRAIAVRMAARYALRPLAGWRTIRAISAYRRAQEELRPSGGSAAGQIRLAASLARMPEPFVRAAVEQWMEREPLSLLRPARRPGLEEFLAAAKERGLKLAVCSDYDPRRKLEALGVSRYFDAVVCAQDPGVGRFKPDPRMLAVALERLGARADEALFLGDRANVDGKAAGAAGIRFILIGGGVGYAGLLEQLPAFEIRH